MHDAKDRCLVDPYGGIDSDLEPLSCKDEETKTEGMAIGHTAVGYMVFL